MDSQQQFCLKWNSFGNNLTTAFSNLFKSETLADVTLFCEGVTFKAHKLILAACSKHLAELFETAPHHQNLLVILDGISAQNMAALLEFMYKGEVHVIQENLSSFLKAADCLQVKGLSIEHEKLAVEQSQRQQQQHQQQQMLIPSSNIMGPRNNKSTKLSSPLMTSHESLKSDLSHHHPHLFQPQHLNHHHINHTSHHHHLPPHTHNLLPSQQTTSSHLSSAYSSPVLSHYLNQYHPRPYETHLPHHTSTALTASAASAAPALSSSYNIPKKRHLRNSPTHSSPSLVHDTIRASVLRDGSKPIVSASTSTNIERNGGSLMSPGSVSYRASSTSSLPTGQSELDQSIVIDDHSTPAQNSSGSYEMEMSTTISSIHEQPTIVVENSVEIASEIDSNCPEDLRMKSEIEQENDLKEDISTSTSYSNGSGIVVVDGCSSNSTSLRTQSPHLSSVFQHYGNNSNSTGSNVNSSSAHSMFEAIVDSHTKSSPLSDSGAHPANVWSSMHEKYLKKPNCVNTPDGKKLKCPFCERLYGYETNLRAHIRQRHQGIRVPCPFCTRTFTRNNTVRRHIAREHKTDLSLKAYHEVQNHHSHALQQHAILQQQLQQQEQQQQRQQVSHSMLPLPLPPPSTSSLRQSQERRSSLDSPHTPPSSPHESEQKQHDSQL